MCDTFLAPSQTTAFGHVIFGKNSDREPNEAQAIVRIPAQTHTEKKLRTTYIEIPQVNETFECFLSKPFQMWGAEMGVNEYGLAIGNEAVFTKISLRKANTGLTGMDMLRLALERTKTAPAALDLITQLIEIYGQDACGGYQDKKFFYHNSFIISDPEQSFVLETAGQHWVVQRIRDFRSISNGLTIEEDFDLISRDAESFARKKGWTEKGKPFNFRRAYSDWFYTHFSHCKTRHSLSTQAGKRQSGKIGVNEAIEILQSHQVADEIFIPSRHGNKSVCMHASGLTAPSQTTGSMVAVLRKEGPHTVWFTGTSTPCLSVFKPFVFGGESLLPENVPPPGPKPDHSLWWLHERLHRKVLRNYRASHKLIRPKQAELQSKWIRKAEEILAGPNPTSVFEHFSSETLNLHKSQITEWEYEWVNEGISAAFQPLYHRYWKRQEGKWENAT